MRLSNDVHKGHEPFELQRKVVTLYDYFTGRINIFSGGIRTGKTIFLALIALVYLKFDVCCMMLAPQNVETVTILKKLKFVLAEHDLDDLNKFLIVLA